MNLKEKAISEALKQIQLLGHDYAGVALNPKDYKDVGELNPINGYRIINGVNIVPEKAVKEGEFFIATTRN